MGANIDEHLAIVMVHFLYIIVQIVSEHRFPWYYLLYTL